MHVYIYTEYKIRLQFWLAKMSNREQLNWPSVYILSGRCMENGQWPATVCVITGKLKNPRAVGHTITQLPQVSDYVHVHMKCSKVTIIYSQLATATTLNCGFANCWGWDNEFGTSFADHIMCYY